MQRETPDDQRLSEHQRRSIFFYAEYAAGMYDITTDLVIPHYELMQEVLIQALLISLANGRLPKSIEGTVLDIGTGTGTTAIRVLRTFPRLKLVGIDICNPMLFEFRQKARSFETRYRLLHSDILDKSWDKKALCQLLPSQDRGKGFCAILTSLTLHHFDSDAKHDLYRRLFGALARDQAFINADLFDFSTSPFSKAGLQQSLSWIEDGFRSSRAAEELSRPTRIALRERWKEHYLQHNQPLPISDSQPKLSGTPSEEELLRSAGFGHIEVPFRLWQLGIVVAKKGAE